MKYFSFFSALMCIALYFFVHSNQTTLAIIAFSLIHGFICTVPIGAKSLFFSELTQKQTGHISGIIGAVSFSGRIFSITVLSAISFLSAKISPSCYLILLTLTFFMCGLVTIKWMSLFGKSILKKTIWQIQLKNICFWSFGDQENNQDLFYEWNRKICRQKFFYDVNYWMQCTEIIQNSVRLNLLYFIKHGF